MREDLDALWVTIMRRCSGAYVEVVQVEAVDDGIVNRILVFLDDQCQINAIDQSQRFFVETSAAGDEDIPFGSD